MYNFAKKNGVKVTKSLVPWWMRKVYGILEERYSNKPSKMATSSIVPDNLSDPAVCIRLQFGEKRIIGGNGANHSNGKCIFNYKSKFRFVSQLKSMDANRYATKKTIAQGMLDIALLTANASQLKYILQVGERHEFYTLMLIMISVSIIMQVNKQHRSFLLLFFLFK